MAVYRVVRTAASSGFHFGYNGDGIGRLSLPNEYSCSVLLFDKPAPVQVIGAVTMQRDGRMEDYAGC